MFNTIFHARITDAGFLFTQSLLLITLLVSSIRAEVGIAISGTVTSSNGNPLYGAYVQVAERTVGAVTNWEGRFALTNLTPGIYTLITSHIGYKSSTQTCIDVQEGSITSIHIVLELKPIKLPAIEVVSSSTHFNRYSGESTSITNRQWSQRGLKTIGEAIRDIPGVTLLEGDGRQRISLRGSPARAVKVDFDGIPLNDAGTGEALVDQINIDNLAAIIVEFSGYGGEVHLLTNNPELNKDINRCFELIFENTEFGRNSCNARLEQSNDFVGGIAQLHYFNDNGEFRYKLDDGIEYKRINNAATGTSGNFKLRFNGSHKSLDGGVYYETTQRGVPGLIYSAPTPGAYLQHERLSTAIVGHTRWKEIKLETIGYLSDYTGRYTSPEEQYNPATGSTNRYIPEDNRQIGLRYGLRSFAKRESSSSNIRLGYEFKKDEYKGENLLYDKVTIGGVGLGNAQRTLHSIQLETQLRTDLWGLTWKIDPTLSHEWIHNHGINHYSFFLPNISVTVCKSLSLININFYSGWGRSLNAPPFNALFTIESMFAVGNRKLKPEKGESYSAGFNLTSNQNQNTPWRLTITGYYRHTKDQIVWRRNSFGKYYPDNITKVKNTGIEFSGWISPLNGFISVSGSYIYNNPVIDTPGYINRGNVPPLLTQHSGSANISVKIMKITFNLNGRWVGRRYSTDSNLDPISTAGMGLSPYAVYDFFCSYSFISKLLNTKIEAGMNNILNRSYRIVERSPMPGRSYSVRLVLGIL